jgi:hypothetical protein
MSRRINMPLKKGLQRHGDKGREFLHARHQAPAALVPGRQPCGGLHFTPWVHDGARLRAHGAGTTDWKAAFNSSLAADSPGPPVRGIRAAQFRLGPQRPGRRTRTAIPRASPGTRHAHRGHRQQAERAGHARVSARGTERSPDVRPARHRQQYRPRRLRRLRRPGRDLRAPSRRLPAPGSCHCPARPTFAGSGHAKRSLRHDSGPSGRRLAQRAERRIFRLPGSTGNTGRDCPGYARRPRYSSRRDSARRQGVIPTRPGGQRTLSPQSSGLGIQPARYVREPPRVDDTVTEGVNSWRVRDFPRYADLMMSPIRGHIPGIRVQVPLGHIVIMT